MLIVVKVSINLIRAKRHSANQTAQKNLLAARQKQASPYAQGHRAWKPFAAGQTVWLSRPKKWKFGKKWIGPYKISGQNGVNYVLRSNTGKSLVAHHDQLRLCPTPLGQGSPVQPIAEAPGIVFAEPEGAGGRRYIVWQRVLPDPHVFARL